MKYLLALLLFISSGVLSAQEVTTTGNIVDPTKWNNVIPMTGTQLSQVEGTGGGPMPAYNLDTNTIRFSYFPYTASQIIAINSVLSGQGISVGGFNYSWKIYNDLENCCGTRGSLVGTVNFASNSGKILESYTYDYSSLNTGADFQKITGTETFSNPYQLNSLGYVGVAWTGSDMNFWSGYYGPRVRETSITLNYTVKQPAPTTNTNTNTTTDTTTTSAIDSVITAATEPVPTPITQTAQTTTDTNTNTSQPISTTTQPVTSTSIAPAVVVSDVTKEKTVSGPSLNSILSTIKNNQDKQNAIAMSAIASANDLAASVVQQAEKTAMDSAVTSTSTSNNGITSSFSSASNSATVQSIRNLSPIIASVSNTNTSIYALRPELRIVESAVDSQSVLQDTKTLSLKPPSNDALNNNSTNDTVNSFGIAFGKKGDPIQDYIEANNSAFNEMKSDIKPATVKQNTQDNDLAGGVKIERMAVVPNGFNAYSAFIMTNIAFYEPKEIYKNNVPKDNVRSMYFLEKGNTDTYNKMIEGQYK